MIKIHVIKNNNEITKIVFNGHALYDDYGKDIVCAGVSSIMTTTVNAILKYDETALKYSMKDNVTLNILKQDKIVNLLLENMLELFKDLENDYPKNITIREDEKDE